MKAHINPYVGLVPYTERDADWFFGRDREVRLIAANLRAARLTLLYGASGAGKTSILMAGLLPKMRTLQAEHAAPTVSRSRGGLGVADRVPFAISVFREWRDPPLPALTEAIRATVREASGTDDTAPWNDTEPLVDWLHRTSRPVRTILVVLDQFEEYFMYHPDEDGPGTFAGEFPAAVNDPSLRVNFLLSLREDSWSKLDRFKGRIPELFGNYLRVEYLDRDAARVAVVQPVEHANELLPAGVAPVSIEPSLVDAVLDAVRTGKLALADSQATPSHDPAVPTSAVDRVETPYLQLVMARLWVAGTRDGGRELTLSTLGDLGGAAAIVSSHLTEAMNELSREDQCVAADVFAFLVTPSKTKIAHRAPDLVHWSNRPEGDVRRVLDGLARGDQRILRRIAAPGDEHEDRYEIFHDVLAEAVLEWSAQIQEEERARAEQRARARARRKRVKRLLAAGLLAVGVVFAIAFVIHNRSTTSDATRRADQAARERDMERSRGLAFSSAAQLSVDPERSLLLALAALDNWETPEAGTALSNALVASHVRAAYLSGKPRPCPSDCRVRASQRAGGVAPTLFAFGFAAVAAPAPSAAALPYSSSPAGGAVAVSPDGKTVALERGGKVQLWEPVTGSVRSVPGVRRVAQLTFIGDGSRLLMLTDRGNAIVARPDGRGRPSTLTRGAQFAAGSKDGRYVATSIGRELTVTSVAGGRRWTRLLPVRPNTIAFAPADRGLIMVAGGGTVGRPRAVRWRTRPSALTSSRRLRRPTRPLQSAMSENGRLMATTNNYGRCRVWDVPSGRLRFVVPRNANPVSEVRFDPAGRRVLTVTGNVATIWTVASGRTTAVLGGHTEPISSTAFSPNGALVATAAADGSARVWDARTGAQFMELRGSGLGGRTAAITRVEFTPDSRFAVTADQDGVTRLWDVTSGRSLRTRGGVLDAAFTGAGQEVVYVTRRGRVGLWQWQTGRDRTLMRLGRGVDEADIAAGGRALVAMRWPNVDRSPTVVVGDPQRRRLRRIYRGFRFGLSIAPDGQRVFGNSFGGLREWTAADRQWRPLAAARRERRRTAFGTYSSDGQQLLLLGFEGRGRVLDLRRGRLVRLRGASVSTSTLGQGAFSPDGLRVVAPGRRDAVVWDARTGKILQRLAGHRGEVLSAAYSATGKRIVTTGADRSTRLWDARTGNAIGVLGEASAPAGAVAFDSGGRNVVSFGFARDLEVTSCTACRPLSELKALAHEHLTRELNAPEKTAFVRRPRQP